MQSAREIVSSLLMACVVFVAVAAAQEPSKEANDAKKPEAKSVVVADRPLEDWLAELAYLGNDGPLIVKRSRSEKALREAASTEPEISRAALRLYADRKIRLTSLENIHHAAGDLSRPALYETLADRKSHFADPWCLKRLVELNDESPEAVAALVECLHSKSFRGEADDDLPKAAAERLGKIGLPALKPLLDDRRRSDKAPWWNHEAIHAIGLAATDDVLKYSLDHPEDFLDSVLGRFCRIEPAKIAPKLAEILKNEEHAKCRAGALRSLALAVEPEVKSYRRIAVEIEGDGIADLAANFLDEETLQFDAAKVIAGWTPRSDETKRRVVNIFREKPSSRSRLIRAIAVFPELPEEVATPLLEMHDKMAFLHLEPWRRALSKLDEKGKAQILGTMRERSAVSPVSASGVAALDPSPTTRAEMREALNALKKRDGEMERKVEALLKWVPDI